MQETWVNLHNEGFAEYSVSSEGRVRRDESDRIIKPIKNTTGYLQVGLYKNGLRKKVGLNRLIANAFLLPPKEPHFNTLMHKDGDRTNSRPSNLVWRPRWFVIKYHQQFETWKEPGRVRPVIEIATGKEYSSIVDVAIKYGLLFVDVLQGIYTWQSPLFAEGKIFAYK